MARTGKIARLPASVRAEINQRLHDGQLGSQILPWINSHPDALVIIRDHFAGAPINAQNLSDWRQGGYQDWLKSQDSFCRTSKLAERAVSLAREAGGNLSEGAAAIVSGRILEALEGMGNDATLEDIVGLSKTIALLRAGDVDQAKLRQKDSELKLATEKFRRDTCELFLRWSADRRAAEVATSNTSHTDKIEALGQLMFGDDWKPAERGMSHPASPPT
jgi:hypothetical protein